MALSPHKYSQVMLRPGDKMFGSTNDELRAVAYAEVVKKYGGSWMCTHEERHVVDGEDPTGVPYPAGTFLYTSQWAPKQVPAA